MYSRSSVTIYVLYLYKLYRCIVRNYKYNSYPFGRAVQFYDDIPLYRDLSNNTFIDLRVEFYYINENPSELW